MLLSGYISPITGAAIEVDVILLLSIDLWYDSITIGADVDMVAVASLDIFEYFSVKKLIYIYIKLLKIKCLNHLVLYR